MQDPEQWIADMNARAEELKRKSEAMTAELSGKKATATSANGAVTITVNPNGGLDEIKLGHRACELGHTQLGTLIMQTFHRAMQDLSRDVMATFQEHFPDAEESLELIRGLNPYELDEEEDETPQGWQPVEPEPEPEPEPVRAARRPAPAAAPVRRSRPAAAEEDDPADRPW